MHEPPLHSGLDVTAFDGRVRPQDDLFRHVNGRWLDETAIPPDKSSYGMWHVLYDETELAVRAIIEASRDAPPGSEARKIGDLYTSHLNEELVNERGAAPLAPTLAAAAGIRTREELLHEIGRLQRLGLAGFYQLFVNNDPGDPDRYLLFFEQGGLSLPDESYYREEHFTQVRASFLSHVERLLALAGLDEPASRAKRVVDLETALATGHWDNVESRDSEKTYNLMTWADVVTLVSHDPLVEPLRTWLGGVAIDEQLLAEVVLRQPSFGPAVAALLATYDIAAWRDWLTYQVVHGFAPYLSTPFVEENFDFYGRTLSGVPEMRERWKRAISLVEGGLGEAVGKLYVERHYPPETKARMDTLVDHLLGAYHDSISEQGWMSEATRQRALEKLALITPKIGYPEQWRDYSSLVIVADDLLANVAAINAFEFHHEVEKLGRPVDRREWFMTPQTINAYYNPGFNEVVFPAAFLQPPFFDPTRDEAANYGAVGSVIGHEIGHGFDDQGSKFDGHGRLTDWWEPADREAFSARAQVLIEQFNELAPAETPELRVNGALTVGENIGDLGGLAIAWRAYVRSLKGEPMPVIDGLTGAERFFFAFAYSWREKSRKEDVEQHLAVDPHAPAEFRCNQIVRNLDVFADAFSLEPGDGEWLAPDLRVTIW